MKGAGRGIGFFILNDRKEVEELSYTEFSQLPEVFIKGNRRIASTLLKGYWISTVFMPIPIFIETRRDPPMFFETKVFRTHHMKSEITELCSTYKQALEQHERLVQQVQDMINEEARDKEDKEWKQ